MSLKEAKNQKITLWKKDKIVAVKSLAVKSDDIKLLNNSDSTLELLQNVLLYFRLSWKEYIKKLKLNVIQYDHFFYDEFH